MICQQERLEPYLLDLNERVVQAAGGWAHSVAVTGENQEARNSRNVDSSKCLFLFFSLIKILFDENVIKRSGNIGIS